MSPGRSVQVRIGLARSLAPIHTIAEFTRYAPDSTLSASLTLQPSRSVAGAFLYKVEVDGVALAYIDDRQTGPTYIHTGVVRQGSKVVVTPYSYGDIGVLGTPSEQVTCPSDIP